MPRTPGYGPAANRSSFKKLNRDVSAVLETRCMDLTTRLVQRAMETDDDRFLGVVAINVLDRIQGRPTDAPQRFDDEIGGGLDTSRFTEEQRSHCLECARHLLAYKDLSRRLAAEDGVVIEGDVG